MDTLPDLVNERVHILSIGLNPSLPSVKAGFYFANPRNRYWKAINACGYFSDYLEPSFKSCETLLNRYNIGQTDLVKRPTAGGKDLRAADYREGNARLNQLIEQLSPAVIWFHGKLTCQKYLQYNPSKGQDITWGKQSWQLNAAAVFITPNPSPANAAYSLQHISDCYADLFQSIEIARPC
ncbi:MAG: mismatch-specific DNA-glycosylase [Piscirickettsiaceae bacterium]|nr:MAG: mismatch-specific DNA-glycosylase [Piscirickettsiaceae bacterium]PCH85591.1 MAG: mismatch-specific DNA-glycosylase [Piscirickettsiaceae bacterium]